MDQLSRMGRGSAGRALDRCWGSQNRGELLIDVESQGSLVPHLGNALVVGMTDMETKILLCRMDKHLSRQRSGEQTGRR